MLTCNAVYRSSKQGSRNSTQRHLESLPRESLRLRMISTLMFLIGTDNERGGEIDPDKLTPEGYKIRMLDGSSRRTVRV